MNNDTRLDLIIKCGFVTEIYILFGHGDGSFYTAPLYHTYAFSFSAAIGDFNNDTRLDIMVTDKNSNNVRVLLQSNRGALTNELTYASGGSSKVRSMVVHDINNDTQLDIVVANYGTNDIGILFGHDSVTFQNEITISMDSNSQPSSITLGDFNGDNKLDIAVTLSGRKQIGMLLGNGQGSFVRQAIHQTPSISSPLIVSSGDFNNDGYSEIIVGYDDSDSIDMFIAFNTGSFTNTQKYLVGLRPLCVILDYINNDSYIDIVVVNSDSDDLSILLGYGKGNFANPITYSVGPRPNFVAAGDFNNDNRLDLVVTYDLTVYIDILLGHGNGTFSDRIPYRLNSTSSCVAVGDFNNDSRLDVVVVHSGDDRIDVLLGDGVGSFSKGQLYMTYSYPIYVLVADFNNDSRLDIAVLNDQSHNVSIFLGYGNGDFEQQISYPVDPYPLALTVGDLNNDSRLDIVASCLGFNSIAVLLGYGNGSFTDMESFPVAFNPTSVAIGDFNNDGYPDIIAVNAGATYVSVLLGYGDGSFATQITYITGSGPRFVAIADFNNDNKLDIVVANSGDATLVIMFGSPNLDFQKETTLLTGNMSRSRSFVINDFNNDNNTDIIVANSGTHNIGIFLGHGDYSFTDQTTYSTGLKSSPYSLAIGHFNNDTRFDLVTANFGSDKIGVFLGYGDGSFTNQTTYSTGSSSSPYSVAVEYFNSDSTLDIIVVNYHNNKFGIFLGHGDGTFDNIILFAMPYGSQPFSVALADFSHDGKMDFAVANNRSDSLSIYLQTC